MENLDRIGNSEAEIMKVLWKQNGNAITAPEIRKEIEGEFFWTKSTVLTLIRRLVEKGFVSCEKRNLFNYTPLVSEEEYQKYQTRNFINKIYDGSVKNLISTLCRANSMSKNDIEELQVYLEQEANRNG
jgi:BlaI family penicillinase repressor